MNFGKKFRELREKTGKSQAEVAKDMGVSQSSVSGWELRSTVPRGDILRMIADYFSISEHYFFDGTRDGDIHDCIIEVAQLITVFGSIYGSSPGAVTARDAVRQKIEDHLDQMNDIALNMGDDYSWVLELIDHAPAGNGHAR